MSCYSGPAVLHQVLGLLLRQSEWIWEGQTKCSEYGAERRMKEAELSSEPEFQIQIQVTAALNPLRTHQASVIKAHQFL